MYLDCDTTPPLQSKYIGARTIKTAINRAVAEMKKCAVVEGQIGVYDSHIGPFRGYVIKYAGDEPYFEPPEDE